jgi:hypothetical protein
MLFTIANRHLSSGVVTEHNFAMGKSVNDIYLCKNLRLGFWISLNLSLVDFPEIASLNSTLLQFLTALDSGKQDLEESRTSLKQQKSQPNVFRNWQNFTNDFLFLNFLTGAYSQGRINVDAKFSVWRCCCCWYHAFLLNPLKFDGIASSYFPLHHDMCIIS